MADSANDTSSGTTADVAKAARDAKKDAAKTLKCVASIETEAAVVQSATGERVRSFYIFYPPTSNLMPGNRTILDAKARLGAIVDTVAHECNATLDDDQDAAYPDRDAPKATGYTCGAVAKFKELTSKDRRAKVQAHYVQNVRQTVPMLALAEEDRVEHGRFIKVEVVRCLSQGDLDSIVAKLLAWHAENVQLSVARCPYPPVPMLPSHLDVVLVPAVTGALLGRNGGGIRSLLDEYEAVRHFYVLERADSLDRRQYMAVSAEFKEILDAENHSDVGFVAKVLARIERLTKA